MNGPTILLIEDNPGDAALIVGGLARVVPRDHVIVCPDGVAALDYLHARGEYAGREAMPLFALLDLNLPRLGGFEVLRQIRAEAVTRLLPVTVLSGSDRAEDVRMAAQLGANSFVRKPADGGKMTEMLAQLARYWLDLNIPPPCCGGQ